MHNDKNQALTVRCAGKESAWVAPGQWHYCARPLRVMRHHRASDNGHDGRKRG